MNYKCDVIRVSIKTKDSGRVRVSWVRELLPCYSVSGELGKLVVGLLIVGFVKVYHTSEYCVSNVARLECFIKIGL